MYLLARLNDISPNPFFPLYFWLDWARWEIPVWDLEGRREAIVPLTEAVVAHTGLSPASVCCWGAVEPTIAPPCPSSPFGACMCVWLHDEGTQLLQDIHATNVWGKGTDTGVAKLVFQGSSFVLFSPTIHPSSLPACLPVNFKIRYQMWGDHLTETVQPVSTILEGQISVIPPF